MDRQDQTSEEIGSLTETELEAVSGGMAFGVMGLAAAAAGAGNNPPCSEYFEVTFDAAVISN
jgi:hypothetical protein